MALKSMQAVALLGLAGCVITTTPTGETRRESRSIDLDKSEMVRVDLKMGAGELKVSGGALKLMEADFTYNVPSWKPDVRYSSGGFRGNLTVEQPGKSSSTLGNATYSWDIRLSDDVPLDVGVKFGAGEARMDIGSLALRSLEVNMGVGELKLDLRGRPKRDYSVNIHGGVGSATVRLPKDVGILADAAGGIGGISVSGLRKEGGRWVSEDYQHAKVTIRLSIRGGVGEIKLVAD